MALDYYDILGVDRFCSQEGIKKAYKAQALLHHPDRNPGNIHAEEKFKLINEAYQVLSNPISRSKYDYRYQYEEVVRTYGSSPTYQGTYNRPQPQRPRTAPRAYKIDKEYYRVQKILILIFFGLIGAAFALKGIREYRIKLEMEEKMRSDMMFLDSARSEFTATHYETALEMVQRLIQENATDYNFYIERDTMMYEVRSMAMTSFQAQNYEKAVEMFQIIRKFEWTERLATLQLLSTSYARTGRFKEATDLLQSRLTRDPDNISVLYYMSLLLAREINDPEGALPFLDRGVEIFRRSHTEMYGTAFELVVRPENIPEMYYRIFDLKSQVDMELRDYTEAYIDCNWAIFIRSENPDIYLRRIESGVLSGQTGRICRDLNTVAGMGLDVEAGLVAKYCK